MGISLLNFEVKIFEKETTENGDLTNGKSVMASTKQFSLREGTSTSKHKHKGKEREQHVLGKESCQKSKGELVLQSKCKRVANENDRQKKTKRRRKGEGKK